MQDLREYSDQELSLVVMNDESLYKELYRAARLERFNDLVSLLDKYFLYTSNQLAELESDYDSEVEEYNRLMED